MTKKDYEMIAQAINNNSIGNFKSKLLIDKETLINELCYELNKDNNRFDKDRFVKACND